eukprot:15362541-Ditylum_brightwellii.AAC.1
MEKELMQHHVIHFSQAVETLFNQHPSKEIIGYTAQGLLAKQPKNGITNIQEVDVDDYTRDILEELKWKPHYPPNIDSTLTWKHVPLHWTGTLEHTNHGCFQNKRKRKRSHVKREQTAQSRSHSKNYSG